MTGFGPPLLLVSYVRQIGADCKLLGASKRAGVGISLPYLRPGCGAVEEARVGEGMELRPPLLRPPLAAVPAVGDRGIVEPKRPWHSCVLINQDTEALKLKFAQQMRSRLLIDVQ